MSPRRVAIRLVVILWAAIAVTAVPQGVSAADWGLPELMHTLARVKSASAKFTERKTVRMLNAPLVTSGTLTYIAPDQMQKITVSPTLERFALDGDRVTIIGGPENTKHSFSIADYPQIGGLVEGIRATMAGDLAALEGFYAVRLTGTPSDWQLLLQPKDGELTRFIMWVRIAGSGDRIRTIETEESDGDRSDMSIVENVQDGH